MVNQIFVMPMVINLARVKLCCLRCSGDHRNYRTPRLPSSQELLILMAVHIEIDNICNMSHGHARETNENITRTNAVDLNATVKSEMI